MKKLLMSALLILMMFALVGCGEKAGGNDDSDSSDTNKFKGTTWGYEYSEYDDVSDEVFTFEGILKFKTDSSGTMTSIYYINSVLTDEYEFGFEYTVQSSTTCILVEDGGYEYKCVISGSELYFYDCQDDSLICIMGKK